MNINLAERMGRLGTESAFEMGARARALEAQGRSIIHLEIGEPDFDTPANIVDAGCKALYDGYTHYNPPEGYPALRNVIAEQLGATRGYAIDPAQIVVTPGAKPIMFLALLALAEPGTEIIYPNPGFPIYESMIEFSGAKAVALPLREEYDFRFDIDEFRSLISDKTRLIVLNTPQNPTGGALTPADLEAIAEECVKRDIMVLSDEIYEHIIYDDKFTSITSLPGMSTAERSIILHGFSKTYAMTGWRLGFGIMPVTLAEHIKRLVINSNSCTAGFTQMAGVEALTGSQQPVQEMVAEFRRRRDIIVAGLNAIDGISCRTPGGAFYVFPNIKGTGMTSRECADFFLTKAGVACLSGGTFGRYGEGHVRMSYANSVENIELALERIKNALAAR